MSIAGNTESMAALLRDKAHNMNRVLSSEVYGGRWGDDVGRSYLSYAETLTRIAESFGIGAESVRKLENGLNAVDESADKRQLNALKSAVNRL